MRITALQAAGLEDTAAALRHGLIRTAERTLFRPKAWRIPAQGKRNAALGLRIPIHSHPERPERVQEGLITPIIYLVRFDHVSNIYCVLRPLV
jgi:hypothetical protein